MKLLRLGIWVGGVGSNSAVVSGNGGTRGGGDGGRGDGEDGGNVGYGERSMVEFAVVFMVCVTRAGGLEKRGEGGQPKAFEGKATDLSVTASFLNA